jgi:hypothetical protein
MPEAKLETELHEGVQERICSCVGCLAAVADCTGCRGERDKEIEGNMGECLIEVPGSTDFGCYYCAPLVKCHFLEENILVVLIGSRND